VGVHWDRKSDANYVMTHMGYASKLLALAVLVICAPTTLCGQCSVRPGLDSTLVLTVGM